VASRIFPSHAKVHKLLRATPQPRLTLQPFPQADWLSDCLTTSHACSRYLWINQQPYVSSAITTD
jgi:hypothetical protein